MDEGRLIEEEFRLTRAAIGEMKKEIVGLSFHVEQLANRVEFQNGRVGKLEGTNALREIAEAQARGFAEARRGVAITKRQLAAAGGVLGALFTLAGAALGIVVKLL